MTEKNDLNLLNPEKPLTFDIAQRFMEKYKDYYAIKRDLNPTGKIIQQQTKTVLPQQIASARE